MTAAPSDATIRDPETLPRLLPSRPLRRYDDHVGWFGRHAISGAALLLEVERSGVKGHGGANFPTATKMHAVASRRGRRVVVANGAEGEPASAKDKTLMGLAPHLVLDGAAAAASAVGASEVIVCIDRVAPVATIVADALAERSRRGVDAVTFKLERPPHRYVAGEETALVSWLNGGDAKPKFVPPRPFEKGVAGRPTLVQNVETLAHIALISRFGSQWFRGLGTESDPGSALVTVSGSAGRHGVYEVPLGIPLRDVLRATETNPNDVGAVLLGGYFGTWIPADALATVRLSNASLQSYGAGFGCGVIGVLPHDRCGLAEAARIFGWLASQHAGQCGPCVNGLESIASALMMLVRGGRGSKAERDVARWIDMVKGRGACKHPDGAVRFLANSLHVFADEVERHRRRGPCPASERAPLFPLPATGGWR